MAFENFQGYGQGYNAYNPYMPRAAFMPQVPTMPQGVPQAIQNNGFVSVRSVQEAFNYPVAPGNSILFKDENAPFIYTKTKGFSQLEEPVFERYRLVKEEPEHNNVTTENTEEFALKSDLSAFQSMISSEIKKLQEELNKIKGDVKNADEL